MILVPRRIRLQEGILGGGRYRPCRDSKEIVALGDNCLILRDLGCRSDGIVKVCAATQSE
jgi:hypothetical protein